MRFRLRGVGKADSEWTLVCLVHNIKEIYARITAKGSMLDGLTRELAAVYNPCSKKQGVLPAQGEVTLAKN